MNKKVWYWVLGILAAAVVAVFIWRAASPAKAPQAPATSPEPTATAGGQIDHSGMDHGNMDHGPSAPLAAPELRAYLEDQDQIMMTMMRNMENIEHSGNAAIDFLAGMIPHHASAVAMADCYLEYGGAHEVLAPLAEAIITAQTEEIAQMNDMIQDLKAGGETDAERADAYLAAYAELMDHSMAHASAVSLDAAFAEGMIVHHQMAVDMANAILPYTEEEDVISLAKAIVETQEQEITDMQKVLDGL